MKTGLDVTQNPITWIIPFRGQRIYLAGSKNKQGRSEPYVALKSFGQLCADKTT